jgi:hypothetical protein
MTLSDLVISTISQIMLPPRIYGDASIFSDESVICRVPCSYYFCEKTNDLQTTGDITVSESSTGSKFKFKSEAIELLHKEYSENNSGMLLTHAIP